MQIMVQYRWLAMQPYLYYKCICKAASFQFLNRVNRPIFQLPYFQQKAFILQMIYLTTHFFSQALKLICGKTSQRFKLFQKTTSLQSNGRQARGYPIKFEQSNTLNVPHWHNVGSNRSVGKMGCPHLDIPKQQYFPLISGVRRIRPCCFETPTCDWRQRKV